MGVIKILKTSIVIEGYTGLTKLEKMLQKFDEHTFTVSFSAYRVIENQKTGSLTMSIPRSFPITLLEEFFPDYKVFYVENIAKVRTVRIECYSEARNELQENCLKFMLDNTHRPQLLIHLRVGDGKTWLALKYISEMSRLAVIVLDEEKTLIQWKNRILEHTDIQEHEIGIIQGMDSFAKLLKRKDNVRIMLGIHRTFRNVMLRDPPYLNKFFTEMGVGIKIVDEAHVEYMNTFSIDSHSNIPNNLYLTGTAGRTDWKEDKLMNYIMPVKYAFGKGSAVVKDSEKFHTIVGMQYDTACPADEEIIQSGKRGYSTNEWAEYTLRKASERFSKLARISDYIIQKEVEKSGVERVFIVLKTLAQCQQMEKELIELGYEEESIGQFNTLIKNVEERFKELDKSIVISTDKSLGKALDTDMDMIIDFVPCSSKGGILQLSGRLRAGRTKGLFYYAYDKSIEAHSGMWVLSRRTLRKIAKDFREEVFYDV